jgi:hypothetical protein
MGTRSVIARPIPEGGFHGTYCHYDGYPAHQGRVLFDAVTGHFAGDTDAACSYLIDQHPAGRSVLHGDFTTPPGYQHPTDPNDRRNQCYCHGQRHDPPRPPLDTSRPEPPGSTMPMSSHPTGCRSSPAWTAAGSQSPNRPGPTPRTGTRSTATPTTCAASTDRPVRADDREQPSTPSAVAAASPRNQACRGRGKPSLRFPTGALVAARGTT